MAEQGSHVLLIVTGGIAVYKACEVVRELRRRGETVEVVMTPSAAGFVSPMTFEALSGRRVYTELLPGVTAGTIDHIELGRRARVAAVVPATANFLARLHAGLADDLGSATLLALPPATPVLLAPAMNTHMWEHPVTRRNLAGLQELLPAWTVLPPVEKELACGDTGPGGLPEPAAIVEAILGL